MQRIPEPELMDDPAQARAYAEADFSDPHDHFVALFRERFGEQAGDNILDLGCGPGDICRRFARAYPACTLHGVDAAQAMLDLGIASNHAEGLDERIMLLQGYLPGADLPLDSYDTIISNSLLHHLVHADSLWQSMKKFGRSGTRVFVMDLLRPASETQARQFVAAYAGDEPRILQQDFYNSLLAAYHPDEIAAQLDANDLSTLNVEVVSDRHLVVWGQLR